MLPSSRYSRRLLLAAGLVAVMALGYIGLTAYQPIDTGFGLGSTEGAFKQKCGRCHNVSKGYVYDPSHFLHDRVDLTQSEWAEKANVESECSSCHLVPAPTDFPSQYWDNVILDMRDKILFIRNDPTEQLPPGIDPITQKEGSDLIHYYFVHSKPESEMILPPDPGSSSLRFSSQTFGTQPDPIARPKVANVNIVDLDSNGAPDVLVCDYNRHAVRWIHQSEGHWVERSLGTVDYPGHTEIGDFNGDGHPDLAVANLGYPAFTNKLVGSVELLINDGEMNFEPRTVLSNVGRVADARPADVDRDGDTDLIVAIFGGTKPGQIGWLENRDGQFKLHTLLDKPGGIHVPTADLNGDGRMDFVALVSHSFEEVYAFINQKQGGFERHLLYKANTPAFGSSGIELVDLDQDGDLDILYTNGDAFDLDVEVILPMHGIQWLENKGNFDFEYHDIRRFYGAYRARAADMDGDGDLDIVASSMINRWQNPERKSLIWLENDGQENFTGHGITNSPTHIVTADVGDLTQDGRPDIIIGSMHLYEHSHTRLGRVKLFTNQGPPSGPAASLLPAHP